MIYSFFKKLLYDPLYNALVLVASFMPGADVGLSVIVLTLMVKFAILPLTHSQMQTQRKMKVVEGEIKEIKKRHSGNSQEQTKQIMGLYKSHGINPLSGFLVLLIQIPILLALYFVFTRGIPFVATDLYSFVSLPAQINFNFLGLIDLAAKSIPMALLVGVSQYFQVRLAMPPPPKKEKNETKKEDTPFSFSEELAKSMSTNMRYVMPAMIALISATLPSVVSLYWLVSNLFSIPHAPLVRRKATQIISP